MAVWKRKWEGKAGTGNTEILKLDCWCIVYQVINVACEICTWT